MKKNKEIIWFSTVVFFIALVFHIIVGIPALWLEDSVSINIKDTYFVIAPYHILSLLAIVFFFIIYFTRILVARLKNSIANSIFIIVNLFLINFFGQAVLNYQENQFDYISLLIFIILISFEIFLVIKTIKRFRAIYFKN